MKAILKYLVKILGLSFAVREKNLPEMTYSSSINEPSVYLPQAQQHLSSNLNSTLLPEVSLTSPLQNTDLEGNTHGFFTPVKKIIDVFMTSFFSIFFSSVVLMKYFPTLPNKLKKTINYIKQPFLTAVEEENINVAKVTLLLGANVEQVNAAGKTALDLISSKPSTEIASLIFDKHVQKFEKDTVSVVKKNIPQTFQIDVLNIINAYLCPEAIKDYWKPKKIMPQLPLFSMELAKKMGINRLMHTFAFSCTQNKKRKNSDLNFFDENFVPEPKKQKNEQPNNKRTGSHTGNEFTIDSSEPVQENSVKKRRIS